jgi:hypothetical protein
MKLGAAAVCFAMLYGLDALSFDGRYFAAIEHVLHDIYAHWSGPAQSPLCRHSTPLRLSTIRSAMRL